MADNVILNPGSAGSTIAADDIGGVHFQRNKLIFGPDGTNSGDVSLTVPLPVGAVLRTDAIAENSTTLLVPKFAVISASTAGDNTLVVAVASKKLRVLSLALVATGGANTIRFESGASGTALSGQMDITSDGQLVLPFNPVGWVESAAGVLLNLELSAATSVAGCLTYVEAV